MAAYCLSRLGCGEGSAGPAVLRLLQDTDLQVRSNALLAVRARKQKDALPVLEALMRATPPTYLQEQIQTTIEELKRTP
jgi:HEAT repeat protein